MSLFKKQQNYIVKLLLCLITIHIFYSCSLSGKISSRSSSSGGSTSQPGEGGDTNSPGGGSGSIVATKLRFADLPADTRFGLSNGRLTVQAVNDQGLIDTSFSGEVELQLSVDPNAGQTQVLKAVRTQATLGVAVFEDYLLSRPGVNFKLAVVPVVAALTPAITPNFNVTRTNLNYGLSYDSLLISGNRAYASAGYDGVEVYDISTPSSPSKLYTIYTNGQASSLVLKGTTLFVLNKWENIAAYDLSNENNIQLYSKLNLSEYVNKIALTGNYIFAFDGQYIRVVSVTDPNNMSIVASIDSGDTGSYRPRNTLAIEGSKLYTRSEGYIYRVYDISTPTSPSLLGSATASSTGSKEIAVLNNRLYTESSGSIREIDFTNPASPVNNKSFDYFGASNIGAMSIIDNDLFFYGGINVGLLSLKIPFSASSYDTIYSRDINLKVTDQNTQTVSFAKGSGSNLFVLSSNGLRNYSYQKMTSSQVGTYNTPGLAYDVEVVGTTAYVADGATGVILLDISNPTNPSLISTYNTAGTAREVLVSGTTVYVADGTSGVACFDVQNPSSPGSVATGTINTGGTAYDIEISGSTIIVATDTGGIKFYTITGTCTFSAQVGSITFSGARQIAVDGNYLFASNSMGNYVYDISNPASPSARLIGGVAQKTNSGGGPILVSQGQLWSKDTTSNLSRYLLSGQIWDNSSTISRTGDYANIRTVENQNNISISSEMALHNNVLYIPSDDYGWSVVDITDPNYPKLVYSFDPNTATNPVQGIAADDDYIYLAQDALGLVIMSKSTYTPLTRMNQPSSVGVQYLGLSNDKFIYKANGVYKNQGDGLELDLDANLPVVMQSNGPSYVDSKYVVVQDTSCYCNNIYSILDPLSPVLTSSTAVFDYFTPSLLTNTRMYAAKGTSGVFIYNITGSSASTVGSYNTPGNAKDLEVIGNYIYVADNAATTNGVIVLDISNESSPQLVTTLNIPNAVAITSSNNTLYVGSSSGVVVVDITQRGSPVIVRTITTTNNNFLMGTFFVKDNHLIFSDNSGANSHLSRAYIYNLSDEQNPTLVETLVSNSDISTMTANSYFIRLHTNQYIKNYFHVNYTDFTNDL